ncbi:MAG: cupin domain-containing protein [Euryarchaeota archaeon]|nr:cupin domain-containing protein [Euryarchaeota archaeon]
MYVKKADEIKKEKVEIAEKTEIQWLIGEDVGKEFYMRRFTMKPGGGMSKHYHNNQVHEQYILKGRLKLGMGDEVTEVKAGDVVYIPEGIPHWYKNEGDENAVFLCLIPKREEYHTKFVE